MSLVIQTTSALGSAIRAARKRAGLSQEQLAQNAGVSRSWLSRLEGGKRTAEIGRILSVLHALKIGLVFESIEDLQQTAASDGATTVDPAVMKRAQEAMKEATTVDPAVLKQMRENAARLSNLDPIIIQRMQDAITASVGGDGGKRVNVDRHSHENDVRDD